MAKAFTTLDDVAKVAGMSRAQVSRALRGDPGVRPETRQRIDDIAAQLNYRPNLAARSLVSSRSSIVGLIIGDPNNPFHIQLAQAVDRCLLASGFDAITSLRSVQDGEVLQEVERLLSLRAAGVILLGTAHNPRVIGEIADKLPCVFIGSKRVTHPQVVSIAVDDYNGVRLAMDHLLALGHTRIAHLAGGLEPSSKERANAYCRVMREAGLEPLVLRGRHNAAFGREGVDRLFARESPPTAILASNDFIALGVLDRLKGMGLSVPNDVSVVGFDDIPDAANALFSLTTLRQDTDAQAQMAVQALQTILGGNSKRKRRIDMDVTLIERSSTGAPASR
ncbi:DNA-binding LacI/PurR family transcriptional regulator [Pseudomonas hunanensis]|uniref:DNA-binding LacI/PurR family transcriptional regulator n=1 Tax=Pseudomonas hunanensis TaxID=1247546 RepID=A0ACC6JZG7_9PSED|nr:LacI family DNA-binding transcriptional regulator [Pseudomonas hunanensis]MDR6711577.1 DNA-binding LacI/PurR family transcriptional regulator [Pseudomonas hunanensis]